METYGTLTLAVSINNMDIQQATETLNDCTIKSINTALSLFNGKKVELNLQNFDVAWEAQYDKDES